MANIRINGNLYRHVSAGLWNDPFNNKQYNRAVMDILKRFPNGYPQLPSSIPNPILDKRKNDLTRKYYILFFLSPVVGDVDASGYDGWGTLTKRAFIGAPSLSYGDIQNYNGTRAYPFSFDPVNLNSTPWHNIVYEYTHPLYLAGWRAFHFQFPFGNYGYSWLFDPVLKATTYTSTTNAYESPARYKGFSQAIKALLDGTLNPGGLRVAMPDFCDVHLYLTSAGGWIDYKNKANAYWDSLPGTTQEKDNVYMQTLNAVADYYIQMKSDNGVLSITLDVAAESATPTDIEVYRLLDSNETWGYRSDVVELTNWYFAQKLIQNGIPVNCESRSIIQRNQGVINGPIIKCPSLNCSSFSGATTENYYPSQWTNFTSDSSWFWYSDPARASLVGDNNFVNYRTNESVEWIHHVTGSASTSGPRLPWGLSLIVNHGGTSRDASFSGPYTPYWMLHQLYMAADTYLNYQYYSSDNEIANEKRRIKTFNTLAIDPYICLGQPLLQPGVAGNEYAWWNNTGVPNPNIQIMPLFDSALFTQFAGSTYPDNYWTGTWSGGTGTGSRAWYNTNVRGLTATSNQKFFDAFVDIATNYKAPGVLVSGITMATASDVYYTNIIDPILRGI